MKFFWFHLELNVDDASDFLNILGDLQDTGEINLYNDTITGQLTSNEVSIAQDNSIKETGMLNGYLWFNMTIFFFNVSVKIKICF